MRIDYELSTGKELDEYDPRHSLCLGDLLKSHELALPLGHFFRRIGKPHPVNTAYFSTCVQQHPHWRDCLLFYEYFHGDNGAGLGASHQTGWTGIIARIMHLFATLKPEQIIESGKMAYAETTADVQRQSERQLFTDHS